MKTKRLPALDSILKELRRLYSDAECSLEFKNPFQLLVATILSAQCTDERVNKVTPALFKAYPDAKTMASAKISVLENLIRSTGFFKNKAKSIKGATEKIANEFGGRVPEKISDLICLPGVGRKTANVVLGNAFGNPDGVVVDTHVKRLSYRLGLTKKNGSRKNRGRTKRKDSAKFLGRFSPLAYPTWPKNLQGQGSSV